MTDARLGQGKRLRQPADRLRRAQIESQQQPAEPDASREREQPLRRRAHQLPERLLRPRRQDEPIASSLIDRLVHHAAILSLKGDSYRLRDRCLGGRPPCREPRNRLTNQPRRGATTPQQFARWLKAGAVSLEEMAGKRKQPMVAGGDPPDWAPAPLETARHE